MQTKWKCGWSSAAAMSLCVGWLALGQFLAARTMIFVINHHHQESLITFDIFHCFFKTMHLRTTIQYNKHIFFQVLASINVASN